MANARRQNVWVIDTTGAITASGVIKSIKLCSGADASTVSIQADDVSGAVVYQAQSALAADHYEPNVCLSVRQGFYITLTGTAPKVYLYLE